MAENKDLVNPFHPNRTFFKMFNLLQEGPKTGRELVEQFKVSKTIRQLSNTAGCINSLSGLQVRVAGDPQNPDSIWEMVIKDPKCIILRNNLPSSQVSPVSDHAPILVAGPAKAPTKIGMYIPPENYAYFRDSAADGENVFLVGPTGSGKTEMAIHVAKDLEFEFVRQNFNGETTVDNMVGCTEVRSENDVPVTYWRDGILSRACRNAANGKKVLYVADEVTAGKPDVLFHFHQILELKPDGSREAEVNGEVLKIPKGMLTIVATSNSFRMDETGLYQGTNAMNMAFANRWSGGIFFVDYAPNEHEIMENHGIERRIALALSTMAKEIREKGKADNYPVVCSTRQLIAIGKKSMKWGCKKGLEYVYLNSLTTDEYQRVVGPIISNMTWPR